MTHVRERWPSATAVGLASAATTASLLPVFLVGATAVQLMDDLGLSPVALGSAVASYRIAGAISSPFLGGYVDRLGATRSVRVAALAATVATLGLAATTTNVAILIAWLAFLGVANGATLPAANRLLARSVRGERLGVAFGVKQAAVPVASMLAGAAVPVVSLTVGWRWTYVMAGALAVAVAAAASRPTRTQPPEPQRQAALGGQRLTLVLLSIAFGLGTMTSSAITTFLVVATVEAGGTAAVAGTFLATASVAAIVARLLLGWVSDRLASGHLYVCAGLLGLGAAGCAAIAQGQVAWIGIGALFALAGSWGFAGVLWYAILQVFPDAPGAVTGALAPGGLLGNAVGPLLFGAIASAGSLQAAWHMTVFGAALGALAMAGVGRRLLPHRDHCSIPVGAARD